jgi:Family of unknown function (DUF6492)
MIEAFDIVICCGPKDICQIEHMISYTKKNVLGYRKIYIISCDKSLDIPGCITIDESIFPFSEFVSESIGETERTGWYLQQLYKLYVWYYLPDILTTYLVIDADTYFLRPTKFVKHGENNKLYLYLDYRDTKRHMPYFEHMSKLHPTLNADVTSKSGICHHMMFHCEYVAEMFQLVEIYHHGKEFWKVFLENVANAHKGKSGASEYEMYFTYLHAYHPTDFLYKPLNARDYHEVITCDPTLDVVSVHWYWRK